MSISNAPPLDAILTLHDWIHDHDTDFPSGAIGFRLRGGRVIWETAHYPDGSIGNSVMLSRIVFENGRGFTRASYADRDTPISFVSKDPRS